MSIQFSKPLLAPVTEVDKGSKSTLSTQDTIDFLKDDDEKPDVIDLDDKPSKSKDDKSSEKDEDDDKDDEVKEDDELKAIEEELEEPTEEQLELTTPARKKDILAKYPKLFKDFPYLEKAYYREQQYTEIFPNPADARKAVQDSETLNNVEQDLMNGNTEKLLLAAKQENPKAFYKIVDNYLDVLGKVDPEARNHVFGNVVKQTIIAMVKEARKSSNDTLQSAAQIVNQFVFGDSEFIPPTKLAKEEKPDEDKKEVENERNQWLTEKFESAEDDLQTRVTNSIKSTIEQHIDPKESMSEYVRKNATREALESVTSLIEKDARFKILVDKLWDNAKQNKYSKDSIDKIKSAFLSKAKTLLPTVIKSARNEALRGIGKKVRDDSDEPDIVESKTERSTTPKTHERSGPIKSAKDIPKGMKSIDFLMQD